MVSTDGVLVLMQAGHLHVVDAHSQVISMVSTDGVLVAPIAKREEANAAHLKFTSKDGDHLTLLAVARAFAELSSKQQASWCHDNFINIRCVCLYMCKSPLSELIFP
jgi:hypothetical protein